MVVDLVLLTKNMTIKPSVENDFINILVEEEELTMILAQILKYYLNV